MAKKQLDGMCVAVLAADGFEQVELTEPVEALENRGATVEILSLRPGKIRGMNLMVPGKKVRVDKTVATADASDYDALLIPGGFIGPDLVRQSTEALDFVRAFRRTARPIAVICHGPWVLISAELVRGHRLTSWPGIRDDVTNAGGLWVDSPVVLDGNLVSSRSPKDLPVFIETMVEEFAVGRRALRRERERERERTGTLAKAVAGGLALGAVAMIALRRASSAR